MAKLSAIKLKKNKKLADNRFDVRAHVFLNLGGLIKLNGDEYLQTMRIQIKGNRTLTFRVKT